jgi:hypothetical protein
MSIERKRDLLRISREKSRNPNFTGYTPSVPKTVPQERKYFNTDNIKVNTSFSDVRIKTNPKSEYLGKNLYPDYVGKYKDQTFIVAGCGSSLNLYSGEDFSKYYVVGVNDIERILTPDFLVVVNDVRTFTRGRWEFVRDSMSPVIFSHLDDPGPINRKSHLAKIKVGQRNQARLDQFQEVDHTLNSPYMAAIIAYQLGAKKIGMVGVDFTNNHFFSETGTHKLSKHIVSIDNEFEMLRKELEKKGVKVANLSPFSQLESWPKMSLSEFDSL